LLGLGLWLGLGLRTRRSWFVRVMVRVRVKNKVVLVCFDGLKSCNSTSVKGRVARVRGSHMCDVISAVA
jgi:hypothetical protein